MNQRVQKLTERVINGEPEITLDRARILTRAYQQTEGESPVIRRAKTFRKVLEELPVCIRDDELIVGSEAVKPASAQVFPEFSVDWIEREIDDFEKREDNSAFRISEDDKKELLEIIAYWKGKTVADLVLGQIPPPVEKAVKHAVISSVSGLYYAIGHILPDYEKAIRVGLLGIIREARETMRKLDLTSPEDFRRMEFLKAVVIVGEAGINFARRYAEKARELAAKENDPVRKQELENIARICQKVPAQPAETFEEAIQSFWFNHLLILLETKGMGISPGRFDQYMHPYYAKDVRDGRLSEEQALELFGCLWVKFNEVNFLMDRNLATMIGGYPSRQNLVLGGQTPQGDDATNVLTYLCIQATSEIRLPQPSLSMRYHNGTPEKFLLAICDLIKLGLGFPAIHNDEINIPAQLRRGVSIEDARNYALVGCVEISVPGKSNNMPAGCKFNLPKCLELAIHDGKSNGATVGVRTGDFAGFRSFDDFFAAYEKQVAYFVRQMVILENAIDMAHAELVPMPFLSALIGDCIKQCRDVTRGGAVYNFNGPQGVGLANVADSLSPVKKLVFEEKRVTLSDLQKALDTDFEGQEALRQMLIQQAPKYGNDDDYVDGLAKRAMDAFTGEVEKYATPRGGCFQAGMFPATAHISFGKRVGALPDGRKAGEPFADGVSPVPGNDTHGITAVLKSVAKLNHIIASNGTLLNQKLHPLTLKGEKGRHALARLLRSYADLKGMHVQFNVVDAQTLREAQREPQKYRNLVVRVAGWSSFFTGLSRDVQEDIIWRTEQVEISR